MGRADSRERLKVLRQILERHGAGTQEDLREKLESMDFLVTQSTVSRDLRRLGALKKTDLGGKTVYQLQVDAPMNTVRSIGDLVRKIRHNGALIVINTDVGSAPLVARHVDSLASENVLGTIAGDDTVFIAPLSSKKIERTMNDILESMR
jgi:transcriptional regulator of arginine metabolism